MPLNAHPASLLVFPFTVCISPPPPLHAPLPFTTALISTHKHLKNFVFELPKMYITISRHVSLNFIGPFGRFRCKTKDNRLVAGQSYPQPSRGYGLADIWGICRKGASVWRFGYSESLQPHINPLGGTTYLCVTDRRRRSND